MDTVLVVDDEKNYLLVLEALLAGAGYEVITAEGGEEALEIIRRNDLDLVITDMKMPRLSGIELLEQIKQVYTDLPVIMMTAYGTVEKAVEAMKKGAFDYILKPFKNEELLLTVAKALDLRHLLTENRRLRQDLEQRYRFENIIGNSKAMQNIFAMVEKVAQTRATVLLSGESGTGKELIARAIHYRSARSQGPFISVNCGALTETLLESELFGHEKGAFTHALAMRKGRFELAEGGTLFLDEVAEMSPALQVKFLRVLQEMEFERVGGTKTIRVDVRVVAASNRDLKAEVEAGNFREDLFYRLNVVHLHLPPLRQRTEDIPLLVTYFIQKYAEANQKGTIQLEPGVMKILVSYPWPGNVRELENVIERAVILCSQNTITVNDLPPEITEPPKTDFDIDQLVPGHIPLPEALEKIEELMIRRALHQAGYVQVRAAEFLGITKSLLQYKLKKYQIT
jgi:two-component system NtrC family response regulator